MRPRVEWTEHDGRHIAYQVIGEGPPDILLVDEWFSTLDGDWDDPFRARYLRRLAGVARVIRFDKAGTGLSDRVVPPPAEALTTWADDAVAVLDAAGSPRAHLLAADWSGPLGIVLAHRHPDRFDRLVLAETFAGLRGTEGVDGVDGAVLAAGRDLIVQGWGDGVLFQVLGLDVEEQQRGLDGRYERAAASPGAVGALADLLIGADAWPLLPELTHETLVLYSPHPLLPIAMARAMAERIPGSSFEEVDTEREWKYLIAADDERPMVGRVIEFLTGVTAERDANRRLVTMVFLDVVGSTPLVAQVGDREWSDTLRSFRVELDRYLTFYGGRLVNSAGDGFFCVFDSATRAVRFALAQASAAEQLGTPVRAGVHTGECEVDGDDLRGMAVHAAARIMGLAGASEVLVSDVVRSLLGSDVALEPRGTHQLRGVPDTWPLWSPIR